MRFVIPNEAETIIKKPFLFCVFLKRKQNKANKHEEDIDDQFFKALYSV